MKRVAVRVGFLVKTFPRLSETFILNEILGLEEMGWDLCIYSLKRPAKEPVHPGVARVKAPVYYVSGLQLEASLLEPLKNLAVNLGMLTKRPVRYARALARYFTSATEPRRKHFFQAACLAWELEKQGITHLHAHFANLPTALAEIVHWLTGIPFSFTAHAKDIYTSDARDLERRICAATAVMTCTAFNEAHLRAISGPGAAIHLAYHGIDTARFAMTGSGGAAREPNAIPTVLTVGRFSPKKGLEDLIRACAILRDRNCKMRCVIVGYGEQEAALKQLRTELGLEDVIEMPGRLAQPEVVEQYRRAAVFALPCVVLENGDRDGIPNVLFEAMAAGVPVVTTNISGITELVRHEETGWIVDPHKPEALAASIEYVLTHRERAAEVVERARQRVEADFTLEASARRAHEKLLAAVVAGMDVSRQKQPERAVCGETSA